MQKKVIGFIILILIWLSPFSSFIRFSNVPQMAQADTSVKYVCPMHPEVVSDKPGACPKCGMTLVEQKEEPNKNVAILLFDGVQIIDYTAPWEILGQRHFNVYTVAAKSTPIRTTFNMSVVPSYTFENAPKPYILVLPGGDTRAAVNDPATIRWVQKSVAEADHVLTVCSGAFFLARAGLLDGLTATTFHGLIQDLRQAAPKTKVVTDKRYVDNGKIITSAGLTSGMDGSLYLVSKLFGMEKAKELALHLEYNWQPDSNYARADMADKYIRDVNLDQTSITDWQSERNIGGMDEWVQEGTIRSNSSAVQIVKELNQKLAQTNRDWKLVSVGSKNSEWKFNDERGRQWHATVVVEPVSTEPNRFDLTVRVWREGSTKAER